VSARTAVVGGGLAGLTAALGLADRGNDTVVFEASRRLGGLTGSFRREGPAGPLDVDTGQHVFLRCCSAYRGLLDRLGGAGQVTLQERLTIPVMRPGSEGTGPTAAVLRRGSLPPPLHLAGALSRYRLLSRADRLRVARAALALRRVDPADPAADRRTFGDWLADHGQDDRTIGALWDLFGVAALNAPADSTSLGLAAMVFRTGLLDTAAAADIGWSRIPLQQLHGTAGGRCLAEAGAQVRLGSRVASLTRRGQGWLLGTRDGGVEYADQVVLAVPPAAAEALLPAGAVRQQPGWSARLGTVPIVNVHVVYDRPVLATPFLAVVASPVQWIFDRTGPAGLTGGGQYVAVSLSAASEAVRRSAADLLGAILPALAALLPAARGATVLDSFVTRERAATFAPAPGQAALRPPPVTAEAGLVLAGAWTATGWPATMEGAVRSGAAAAAALDRAPAVPRSAVGRPVAA
jgi:hydroxysqualene dehydroxylase